MSNLDRITNPSIPPSYKDALRNGRLVGQHIQSNPFDDRTYVIKDDGAQKATPTTCLEVEVQDLKADRSSKFGLEMNSKKKWRLLLGSAAIILAITIIIVLAVEETRKHGSPSTRPMKRTGLASVYLGSESSTLALFYQNEGGDLRYDQLLGDGSWKQGDNLGIKDTMEKTPIAAITYAQFCQVYYINTAGFLTSVSTTYDQSISKSTPWGDLGFNTSTLPALKSPNTALSIFLDDHIPGVETLHAFVGDESGSIQEYFTPVWLKTSDPWVTGFAFSNATGFSGVGISYDTREENVLIVTTIESDNSVQLWSKIEPNGVNDPLTEGWVRGIYIPLIHLQTYLVLTGNTSAKVYYAVTPNTSLCTVDAVYYQGSDNNIYGATSETEGTYPYLNDYFLVSDASPGTKLACTSGTPHGQEGARLFFQTSAGDIVEYSRDTAGVKWNITTLPTT